MSQIKPLTANWGACSWLVWLRSSSLWGACGLLSVCLCEGEACWAQTSHNQYSSTPASYMFFFFPFLFALMGSLPLADGFQQACVWHVITLQFWKVRHEGKQWEGWATLYPNCPHSALLSAPPWALKDTLIAQLGQQIGPVSLSLHICTTGNQGIDTIIFPL